VAFVVVSAINAVGFWKRSEPVRREDPRTTGVFRGVAMWMGLGFGGLFALVGVAVLVGRLGQLHDIFRPIHAGLPAQVFLGAFGLLQMSAAYGLTRPNVAEMLARHPQIQERRSLSPRGIRVIGWIQVPFFCLWVAAVYAMDAASMGH
jgi:hypothetical protein